MKSSDPHGAGALYETLETDAFTFTLLRRGPGDGGEEEH